MNNFPVKEPDIKPLEKPTIPEKVKEKPVYVPNPFVVPTPKIKP